MPLILHWEKGCLCSNPCFLYSSLKLAVKREIWVFLISHWYFYFTVEESISVFTKNIFILHSSMNLFVFESAALNGAWYFFLEKIRALLLDWGNFPFQNCNIWSQLITQSGLITCICFIFLWSVDWFWSWY